MLQLIVIGFVVSFFQNCAQKPFGSDGKLGQESPDTIAPNVEIRLVNHEGEIIKAGDKVTLSVNYAAVGADSYAWYKVLPFQGETLLATTDKPEYVISTFSEQSAGDYKVIATTGQNELESPTLALTLENSSSQQSCDPGGC